MDQTILGISWLNGQFKAVAVHKGTVTGRWECPEPVEDFAELTTILPEAIRETGYTGSNVGFVLVHARLTHQLVETPPAKGWVLERFIRRRANQLKPFATDAVWSYEPTPATKRARGLVLHLFPKPMFNQLLRGCEEAELHPVRVCPATAVLKSHLRALPIEADEVVLLSAETAGSTTLIIGRKNGEIFLGRSIVASWDTSLDRIVVNIQRTLLYVEQQFGVTVNSIWLFGEGAQEHADMMKEMLPLPIKVSPLELRADYWVEESLNVPAADSSNFISAELQTAPQRRVMLTVTGIMIAALLLSSLVTAGLIEGHVRSQKRAIDAARLKAASLQEQKQQWQKRHEQLDQQKEFVRIVSDEKIPPAPNWFLGYLSDVLPDELVLTQVQVRRGEDLWSVQLAGTLQPTNNPAPPTALSQAVAALTNQLASGPFHLNITRCTGEEPTDTAGSKPPAGSAGRPRRAAAATTNETITGTRFVIEGILR